MFVVVKNKNEFSGGAMSYDGANGGQEGYQYGYPVQNAYGHHYLSGERIKRIDFNFST